MVISELSPDVRVWVVLSLNPVSRKDARDSAVFVSKRLAPASAARRQSASTETGPDRQNPARSRLQSAAISVSSPRRASGHSSTLGPQYSRGVPG